MSKPFFKNTPKLAPQTRQLTQKLWNLSYPTIISFALQSFYDIVDMAWVGQISKEALSGVTLFSTLYMLFTVLNEIAGGGSVAMISQSYGRGTPEKTQKIAEQTISFKILLALISGLLMYFLLEPLLHFYTGDPLVIQSAMEYGYLRIFFIPIMFSSYSVNTIFRCTQDTKTPMKIMIISAVLNLLLDPIFIFKKIPGIGLPGLGLGVFGAALATVISATISFLYGFLILVLGKREVTISLRGLFRLDKKIDRGLIMVGLPAGLQVFVRQFFNATMIKFVTVYGTTAIALAGISGKLNGFMLLPIFGLNSAGATLVGNSLGKDDVKQAEHIARISSWMNTGIVAGICALILLFAPQVMSVFSRDREVIRGGVSMLWITVPAILLMAFNFGKKVVFSGSGYNRPQLISTLISRWFIQLPFMFLVVRVLHLPLVYFWGCTFIAELADYLVTLYYYNKDTWRYNRV